MESRSIANDRMKFVEAALGYWLAIHDKDSERANAQTALGDRIVAKYAAHGHVHDLLAPLLQDPEPKVRFAAASTLLNHGAEAEALPVLEALERDPQGMVAPTARLRLLVWRRKQDQARPN